MLKNKRRIFCNLVLIGGLICALKIPVNAEYTTVWNDYPYKNIEQKYVQLAKVPVEKRYTYKHKTVKEDGDKWCEITSSSKTTVSATIGKYQMKKTQEPFVGAALATSLEHKETKYDSNGKPTSFEFEYKVTRYKDTAIHQEPIGGLNSAKSGDEWIKTKKYTFNIYEDLRNGYQNDPMYTGQEAPSNNLVERWQTVVGHEFYILDINGNLIYKKKIGNNDKGTITVNLTEMDYFKNGVKVGKCDKFNIPYGAKAYIKTKYLTATRYMSDYNLAMFTGYHSKDSTEHTDKYGPRITAIDSLKSDLWCYIPTGENTYCKKKWCGEYKKEYEDRVNDIDKKVKKSSSFYTSTKTYTTHYMYRELGDSLNEILNTRGTKLWNQKIGDYDYSDRTIIPQVSIPMTEARDTASGSSSKKDGIVRGEEYIKLDTKPNSVTTVLEGGKFSTEFTFALRQIPFKNKNPQNKDIWFENFKVKLRIHNDSRDLSDIFANKTITFNLDGNEVTGKEYKMQTGNNASVDIKYSDDGEQVVITARNLEAAPNQIGRFEVIIDYEYELYIRNYKYCDTKYYVESYTSEFRNEETKEGYTTFQNYHIHYTGSSPANDLKGVSSSLVHSVEGCPVSHLFDKNSESDANLKPVNKVAHKNTIKDYIQIYTLSGVTV